MAASSDALLKYVLRLGDNALVLGHRISEWCGHAPILEEDIALANLGLDMIGQARLFYQYAAELEGGARNEDFYAYLRDDAAFSNVLLVEQPNGDFAQTMVRHLLFVSFLYPLYKTMMTSKDVRLAEIAHKAVKEMAYHVRHANDWVVRLGDGTEESHQRAQAALDDLWMFTGEMFEVDGVEQTLIAQGIAPDPASIKGQWQQSVMNTLAEATLVVPKVSWMQTGGRRGEHTEHLSKMLAEMQVLARAHPEAVW